ncbi:MAG: hypothetical protein ABS948_12270 [Solibacillus sp.]
MMKKVNIWAFILSIICILLLFLDSFWRPIAFSTFGIHPLNLLLYMTLITFLLGIIGLTGIKGWIGMTRSVMTIILTLGLSAFLAIVIFFGSILS